MQSHIPIPADIASALLGTVGNGMRILSLFGSFSRINLKRKGNHFPVSCLMGLHFFCMPLIMPLSCFSASCMSTYTCTPFFCLLCFFLSFLSSSDPLSWDHRDLRVLCPDTASSINDPSKRPRNHPTGWFFLLRHGPAHGVVYGSSSSLVLGVGTGIDASCLGISSLLSLPKSQPSGSPFFYICISIRMKPSLPTSHLPAEKDNGTK